jgi:hypothetical protein
MTFALWFDRGLWSRAARTSGVRGGTCLQKLYLTQAMPGCTERPLPTLGRTDCGGEGGVGTAPPGCASTATERAGHQAIP